MITLNEFTNALKVLRSIDADELGHPVWWPRFRDSPYEFFLRAPDDIRIWIWSVLQMRLEKSGPAGEAARP